MENSLPHQLVDALKNVFGDHKARAVHAKGIILKGTFTPSPDATTITKANPFNGSSLDITARFSDFTGIPDIPDNADLSNPKGMAIKFHLNDGGETDIITHSFNGFPTSTALEFRDLLMALAKGNSDSEYLNNYLENHPTAKAFLTAYKPFPHSFATLPYYGVNAFKFINEEGKEIYGRYQIIPVEGEKYYSDDEAKNLTPNFLMDEMKEHISSQEIKFKLVVQIAEQGDVIDDPSNVWPNNRKTVELGTITLTKIDESIEEDKKLIFLPGRLVDGIEVADPMVQIRDKAYPISFQKRQ